jgi:AraC-like DNA-binding protein
MGDQIDYARPDVWAELTRSFDCWPVTSSGHSGWVRCEPAWHWQHRLIDFDAWSVASGTGRAMIVPDDGGDPLDVRLSAGTTLLLRPGDVIDATHRADDPLSVGFVHYDQARPEGDRVPAWLLPPRVLRLADLAGAHDRLRSVIRCLARDDPAGRFQGLLDLRALLGEFHAQAARQVGSLAPPMDPRLLIATELIRRRLDERLTLAEVAAAVRLSPDMFSRLFRKGIGRTFRDYCVSARIDRARELLTETALNVAEIARMLGYTDYRLFARQFALHNGGRSPTVWRRDHRF